MDAPKLKLVNPQPIDGNAMSWTSDSINQIRAYDVYRSDPFHALKKLTTILPKGGAKQPLASFTDTVNDTTGHSGATCPSNKTCFDTTYTYYVQAVDGQSPPVTSPKSNTVSRAVPRPPKK